jgi:hypothetical protein
MATLLSEVKRRRAGGDRKKAHRFAARLQGERAEAEGRLARAPETRRDDTCGAAAILRRLEP